MKLSFSPRATTGSRRVDITMIGAGGKLVR